MSNIKANLCNELLRLGLVKENDVIQHSFTDGGERNIKRCIVSTNGIFPTLTTRPDILGIVVYDKRK